MRVLFALLTASLYVAVTGCTIQLDPHVTENVNVTACVAIYVLDADLTNCPDTGPAVDGEAGVP